MATFGNLETEVEPLAGLMRDHVYIHSLVEGAQEALEAALDTGEGSEPAVQALERVRDLEAYLVTDLVVHIAKEEVVLFPALREIVASFAKVVDEMVEQHDEVRARGAAVEAALAELDGAHAEVEEAKAELSARFAEVGTRARGGQSLTALLDAVKRLSWILQGHFGDEEDDLFAPALHLVPAGTWAELAAAALQLED